MFKTGIRWRDLSIKLGFGSGPTCWRPLRDWQKAGVGPPALAAAREVTRGRPARFLTCSRRFVGGAIRWGGRKTGPNPTDRSRPGSKQHILVDANGVPINAVLTGASRNDVTQLQPLVDAILPIHRSGSRPLQRPKLIYADRGYDSDPHRQRLCERRIKPMIARRRTEYGSGLGKFRWVVERTHAWLDNFGRLRIRFGRRADIHETFLKFGCALVCWNIFRRTEQPF
ncbi:IS5 family transposase [Burkholderia gladioli pv. gladioli]|uniref:IS5 family transposase n=1 Tax=Burkholderia gladioli TaxID=28095 RepID=UPI001E44CA06|nr:IS5 family transposase [Burkholderia gladioli]MDJ1164107.1 IS5 family transposase [Burkholderia gladioli pv. gladioli]